jgi:hypothetical protein
MGYLFVIPWIYYKCLISISKIYHMKSLVKIENKVTHFVAEFEKLSNYDMIQVRGGNTDERTKTKETDVYDTREG